MITFIAGVLTGAIGTVWLAVWWSARKDKTAPAPAPIEAPRLDTSAFELGHSTIVITGTERGLA